MKQYFEIREQYPDAILLFQVGDFYELFFDDAIKASSFLAIALTKRGKHQGDDIPLCGVPIHALNHYLLKLVRGGFKVAICDQMSKPQPGKVVERAVTQVFTPGTLTDEQMLDTKSASYLLSFYPDRDRWGILFTELLTAQMFATSVPADSYRMVESELVRFFPDEVVLPGGAHANKFGSYFKKQGYAISEIASSPDVNVANGWMEKQFRASDLLRLHQNQSLTHSLHLLYWYLKKNQERALDQLRSIQFYQPEDYLILDASTQKNLEITHNLQDGGRKHTLFAVMDQAVTAMGSRMIKKWLARPLVQKDSIMQRQEVVAAIAHNVDAMQKLEELFSQCADLERIVGRIALDRALLNDYLALQHTLTRVPLIKQLLQHYFLFSLLDIVQAKLKDFSPLVELLSCALDDDPATKWTIKKGFDAELDRLRELVGNSQKAVLALEQREIERTGITSLKVRYNNIAGYYIEVTKPNIKRVPEDYIQQQTLVNRNRYTTKELKDLERDIIKAQTEIDSVEALAFIRVKGEVRDELPALRKAAQALAYLDGLLGFARTAYANNYTAPSFHDSRDIVITKGRHPIVESCSQNRFIPNDTRLTDNESIWILTGPNMGGKSTYLRQVALLSIMAQSGSLIPAQSATLPILDRVFTRIGSGDNLAQGKSTFLVEMEETAMICTQATKHSLVILDEVGRGTSTFDGMAIAQAVIEYIVQHIGARCLFATHYHELTHLKERFVGIENYHMASKRGGSGMLFLYTVLKGVAEGSFGIEVAKLAQLPDTVITRAIHVLHELEHSSPVPGPRPDNGVLHAKIAALELELSDKTAQLSVLEELQTLSLDDLSPRKAFDLVWKIKEKS